MTLALVIIAVILLAGAIFLVKELVKKFRTLENHVEHSERAVFFSWSGSKRTGFKRGMYDLVVSPDTLSSPWGATVYVEEPVGKGSGMDPFAYLPYRTGRRVIRLWLGRSAVRIWFVPDGNARLMRIERVLVGEAGEADVVSKPHWWQRLGIAG